MTVQIPAETPFYRPDGSAVLYAGVPAALGVDLTTVQEEGPPIPVNTAGRVYQQRILNGQGDILLTITGVNGAAGRVTFTFTPEDGTFLLPPGDVVAKDLTHQVGELTGNGFQMLIMGPLAIRRLRRGMPATVLQLQAGLDVVVVRYEGAPGPTLLETLIASGDLAEGADEADLVALLQNPAMVGGQAVLTAIANAGAAVTGVGGTIATRETAALAAVATREGQAINAGGAIDVREDAALAAIATREGQAINAGGAIDVREGAALAAVATREGQAINAGGAIDVREDAALAAIATREGQAINAGGAIDVREDAALTAIEQQAANVFGSIDVDADGDTITSTTTGDGGSVDYSRAGRLYVGKVLPHPAHVEDVFYIQTGVPDTSGSGVTTNDVRVFTRAGHGENDYGIRYSFRLLDQRAATSTSSRRENSLTWTEASIVQYRPGGDLYNAALVELLVGTGIQGIQLLEESSGGLSIDNGQTVHESFMASGHGGVFAVEDFSIMADGVPLNTALHGRHQARHLSIFTKERYYRNRAGAITVANPVGLVENEFEFLPGIMRLSSTVTFEQDLTGGMYGHATTVPTAAFTHLTRHADQRRRFGVNDYVGAGGANLEASTRNNVHRVTYDDPVHGELDIVRTVCERYGPGTWPRPSGRLDFGINRATLKVTDDRKIYFELGGSVAGSYFKFSSGEVVKVVTEYRISPPWSNADVG
jgi:hypothetical protein